ncbi:MAG: DUF2089 domain-containing protein [Propionibacteriaceae bacterium]|nr:DUF2089 domain-containing protein [Propionibacteriaceae bacterium]
MRTPHRPLTTCPVCSGELVTTRLGCRSCGTELVGEFGSCSFCALDDAELDLLRVFLTSRGNLKELEKHLGVSYPTARARFHDLLTKLGLAEGADSDSAPDANPDPDSPDQPTARDSEPGPEASGPGSRAAGEAGSVRDQVLAQVASGALAPDVAADLLRRLR